MKEYYYEVELPDGRTVRNEVDAHTLNRVAERLGWDRPELAAAHLNFWAEAGGDLTPCGFRTKDGREVVVGFALRT